MVSFTADQVRQFAPSAKQGIVDALVNGQDDLRKAGITRSALGLQHFMAQIAVESGGLRQLEENLHYSAKRLTQVWPARFRTESAAAPYAGNPEKLANLVYGKRLGNSKPGDGWAYRGSGLLQTTGRENYRRCGHENDPDTLRDPAGALASAIKFWVDNNCQKLAEADDVVSLRRRVNGGTNGLVECRSYLKKAKAIFTGEDDDSQTDTADADADAPTQAPAAAPDHEEVLPRDKVQNLQSRLDELGYHLTADGVMGSRTVAAIAAFQHDNDLPETNRFDKATQDALWEAGPRPVSQERATSVPTGSSIVGHAKTLQTGAVGLMGTAGVSMGADPISSIEGINGYVTRLKSALSPFAGLTEWLTSHWYVALAGVAGFIFITGRKIEQARVADHQSGKTA